MEKELKDKIDKYNRDIETENNHSKIEEEVINKLRNLPKEIERDYEKDLTKIVLSYKSDVIEEVLNNIVRKRAEETSSVDDLLIDQLVFNSFYALNILYRRIKDIEKLRKLCDRFGLLEKQVREKKKDIFKNHPMLYHLLSLYYKSLGTKEDYVSALKYAEYAYDNIKLREHAGVVHNLAETYIEINIKNVLDGETIDDDFLKKAEDLIEKAIDLEKKSSEKTYPKFWVTKAKLKALKGVKENFRETYFEEAENLINKAIIEEDSKSMDYSLRISGYLYELSRIQLLKMVSKYQIINEKMKENEELIEKLKIQSIELLGLFSAIISFIIGGLQLFVNKAFDESISILLAYAGALLTIYSSLGIILYGKKYKFRTFLVFAIGLFLIILSLIIWKVI